MFKVLFFFITIFSTAAIADVYRLNSNSRLVINSDQARILALVEMDFFNGRDVIPQKFTLQEAHSVDGEACRQAGRKEVRSVLEYRDREGVLYSVGHIICVGQGSSSFVLKMTPDSEHLITEVGFKHDVWLPRMAQPGVNELGCGVNTVQRQQVCAPAPYIIYDAQISDSDIDKSSGSSFIKLEPDLANPSCVFVSFNAAGKGYNHIGGVQTDCAESSWFKYTIKLRGYLTGLK